MSDTPSPSPRSDLETISVIGFVHGVSHFFHLLLPPLFPWLMPEFGLTFSGIGMTMTVFFVISGLGQALAGFLVDRFGSGRVLGGGICCFIAASLLLALADSYSALIGVAALAGLGNSVFHPADFTILNRQVAQARLGHAFSIHGLSGNLGWALAPIFMTGLATLASWRVAALGAALLALAALLLLYWRRKALHLTAAAVAPKHAAVDNSVFGFLASPAVWLCFLFFLLITSAFGAIQNFASPILQALYGLTLATAALALSTYLLGGALGILLGGFLAKRGDNDKLIALALGLAALLAILLATGWLPGWCILPLMGGIGFCTGVAGPSRDLLVRKAATARFGQAAYGRVYGFVYSGLDAGLAIAPLAFGRLMDGRRFGEVLIGVAVLQTLAIFTALRVGKSAG